MRFLKVQALGGEGTRGGGALFGVHASPGPGLTLSRCFWAGGQHRACGAGWPFLLPQDSVAAAPRTWRAPATSVGAPATSVGARSRTPVRTPVPTPTPKDDQQGRLP